MGVLSAAPTPIPVENGDVVGVCDCGATELSNLLRISHFSNRALLEQEEDAHQF